MTDREIKEMQRLIDEGIRLAQQRLWERAGATQQSLIVSREGRILEMVPEVDSCVVSTKGDPLVRRSPRP